MRMFNTGLRRNREQFPCILHIASTKRLLSSCALYNVHEKLLIEREYELNLSETQAYMAKRELKRFLICLHNNYNNHFNPLTPE